MILINTTNPLKKKAINRVLRVSDDKLEEVINIIDLLNDPELNNDDIKEIKWYVYGYMKGKLKK